MSETRIVIEYRWAEKSYRSTAIACSRISSPDGGIALPLPVTRLQSTNQFSVRRWIMSGSYSVLRHSRTDVSARAWNAAFAASSVGAFPSVGCRVAQSAQRRRAHVASTV